MSGPGGGHGTRRAAALLLALGFFVLQVPDLFDVNHYHGDERFYTDAAIGMIQSGDFLTPRYPNGGLRFEKPLLSYLALAASYAVFGISLFASRLPFLLAGTALVLATWRAGLRVLRDAEAALLAAAIVAACSDFLTLSARSTPDIFLCLFLMIGVDGYASLLRGGGAPRGAVARGWVGAGLATAVKGGLGALLMAYALAFATASRDRVTAWRRLLHPVWTPLGLAIAAAGFGVYAAVHGTAPLRGSLNDQVAGRIVGLAGFPRHFLAYVVMPFEHLAPWFLLLGLGALRDRPGVGEFLRREARTLRFVLGWVLFLVLLFAAGNVVRGRFLAPAYPPLALVLAGALATLARREPAARILRGTCSVALAILAVGGIGLAVGGWRIGAGLVVAGLATGAAAGAGLFVARRGTTTAAIFALAVALLVLQTVGESSVRGTFSRTPIPALAARLEAPELAGRRVAQIGDSAHMASKLRMATGGRVRIDGFQRGEAEPNWTDYAAIVSDAPLPAALVELGFRVEPCGESWGDYWTLHEILDVARADDPAAVLARRSQPFYLAIRETPPEP
jgi:4-amino-4-deoxy-L-arabinose transferase-like glycosyltransferase